MALLVFGFLSWSYKYTFFFLQIQITEKYDTLGVNMEQSTSGREKKNLHRCNVLILLEGKIWKGVSFSSVQVEQLTSATQEPRWIMIKAKVAMIMNTKKTRPSILGESQIFRLWLDRWPLKWNGKPCPCPPRLCLCLCHQKKTANIVF